MIDSRNWMAFPPPATAQGAEPAAAIVVVGLGNTLRADDGAGVRAVSQVIARGRLPAHVTLLDGGVLGMELLAYLEGATHWLLVDAVRTGRRPGELVRLEGDEIAGALPVKLSLHEAGVLDLLGMARLRGSLPAYVVLWGVEPAAIEWRTSLTPAVAHAVPMLAAAVEAEVLAWLAD